MSSSGEEEETGPTVDAVDPEERIAARRIRIQKRVEAARRAALGEDPNEKKEIKEELTKSRKQIEESRLRLTKLKQDGFDLVTNIRVAGDAREAMRRNEEEDAKRQRKDKLEQEAKSGAERFEEITKKWEQALQHSIPQSLHEMLMTQKTSCDAMIDEKNKLINDFQQELKSKDDQYVKDLKKQADDVDLMIERMEEQIKNLTKALREEMKEIEMAFVAERNDSLELHKRKWEERMQHRRDKEVEYMKSREKRVEDYENQLQHLRVQDSEEYNMVKIRLETDVQLLEQQLQQMRATYQLNQEKLEYNFQVLKKRDDENTITKSQQKRKITRLQDVLNGLRIKCAKQEKQYRDENSQLNDDYKKIMEQFKDLQKKNRHFTQADANKFNDVWCMNEEELKDFVSNVLEADRIISTQQMGLDWAPSDLSFMENIGPLMEEESKMSGVTAKQVVQEVLSATGDRQTAGSQAQDEDQQSEMSDDIPADRKPKKSSILDKISAQTIKQILELLCDESGFLVEQKLNTLLAPLEKDEQSLMKLDAIFSALNIDTEEDIHLLASYFMQLKGKPGQAEVEEKKEDEESKTFYSESEMADDLDAEIYKLTGKEGDAVSTKSETVELINPNEVLKALRLFVDQHRKPQREKGKASQFKIKSLGDRDDTGDSEYWAKYAQVIDKKKERLWDALLEGLEKYSDTLGSRAGLINETDALRQQNAELRMLLHQYVNSKVNAELEVPPTRVLQLEMNPPR
ncbi:dynein regulatory complex protein 1-like [Mya arenaria]|uniref:dynein regulatory complex protein 1-like n=1 Tax=Mya arenaria TaxID=6604 RepID=UPI0022E93108|nr:dynein regulatory complex protein 1-like [Mya arenaria]XP_052765606.1 dynein regulatory complex protein 1-like [Mya arenaria]